MAKKGRKGKKGGATGAQPVVAAREAASSAPAQQPADDEASAPPPVASTVASPTSSTGAGRMLGNALIVIFLAYQVAMPLRYYLRGGGYDERFSWRMFSTLRMQKCQVKVEDRVGDDRDARAVDLNQTLHVAWIGMLERYRRPVVDKLLLRRCTEADVRAVEFERSCTDTDGQSLPPTRVTLDCKLGTFEASEPKPTDEAAR